MYFDPVPVLFARAHTCTLNGMPLATHLRRLHKCTRARRRRTRRAAVILVKETILTFENLFRLTYRRRECNVVNKLAATISEVYFFANFVENPPTHFLLNQGFTLNKHNMLYAGQTLEQFRDLRPHP